MSLLLEFSPLVIAVAVFWISGKSSFAATAALMISMVLVLGVNWLVNRRVTRINLISTVLVLVFGGATLLLHDVKFIQWKATIFYWILGVVFLGSAFIGEQPLAQRLLQPALGDAKFARSEWLKVNFAWVIFCALIGLANVLVAYHASESTWWMTKLLGLFGAMFLFLLAQVWWLNTRSKADNGRQLRGDNEK